jgi:hypothetical protein
MVAYARCDPPANPRARKCPVVTDAAPKELLYPLRDEVVARGTRLSWHFGDHRPDCVKLPNS